MQKSSQSYSLILLLSLMSVTHIKPNTEPSLQLKEKLTQREMEKQKQPIDMTPQQKQNNQENIVQQQSSWNKKYITIPAPVVVVLVGLVVLVMMYTVKKRYSITMEDVRRNSRIR